MKVKKNYAVKHPRDTSAHAVIAHGFARATLPLQGERLFGSAMLIYFSFSRQKEHWFFTAQVEIFEKCPKIIDFSSSNTYNAKKRWDIPEPNINTIPAQRT